MISTSNGGVQERKRAKEAQQGCQIECQYDNRAGLNTTLQTEHHNIYTKVEERQCQNTYVTAHSDEQNK